MGMRDWWHYMEHYACFRCRKCFKYGNWRKTAKEQKCPQCGAKMTAMGLEFRPPKQKDKRGWEKVEQLRRTKGRFIDRFL